MNDSTVLLRDFSKAIFKFVFQLEYNCFTMLFSFCCIYVYTYPPLEPPSRPSPTLPFHLSRLSQNTKVNSLCYAAVPSLAICLTHGSVCMSMLLPQFIPSSPFPAMSTSLFSASEVHYWFLWKINKLERKMFCVDVINHQIQILKLLG